MSTRSTYQFKSNDRFEATTTIYIHYDGYETGAACYFWNLLHVANTRGDLATQFIRANDLAEITTSHEDHSDTEFRYTLSVKNKQIILLAQERIWGNAGFDAPARFKKIFNGNLINFINKYGSADSIDDFSPFIKMDFGKFAGEKFTSKKQLFNEYETAEKELDKYTNDWKLADTNPNMISIREKVARLEKMLFDYDALAGKPAKMKIAA